MESEEYKCNNASMFRLMNHWFDFNGAGCLELAVLNFTGDIAIHHLPLQVPYEGVRSTIKVIPDAKF